MTRKRQKVQERQKTQTTSARKPDQAAGRPPGRSKRQSASQLAKRGNGAENSPKAELAPKTKAGPRPPARPEDARTPEEARMSFVYLLYRHSEQTPLKAAHEILYGARKWPKELAAVSRNLLEEGGMPFIASSDASPVQQCHAKLVLLHRQRIIRELEVTTAADFLLLDAAMDAYLHWLTTTGLVRVSFKNGTTPETAKFQARLAGVAQSYLRIYMDAMQALTDTKRPPIRVLQVQAGHTVAVQVNEQAKALPEAPTKELPHAKRKKICRSAPAEPAAPGTTAQ